MEGRPAPLRVPFGAGTDPGTGDHVALLGGKGAGLVAMTALGLPVPDGFTLTTEAWRHCTEHGWDQVLEEELRLGIADLEARSGRRLGDREAPLLVSVRSGAAESMPGMLATVLDVGMTDAVAAALAETTGDEAFAEDTRRRALSGYVDVVGDAPPDAPDRQVAAAVRAVFASWSSGRAARYREIEGIDASIGTAVTVQAMVFGNLGHDSGSGVAFSRDPSTGEAGVMGDLLVGAQGDDVVSGTQSTRPLAEMSDHWPDAWAELREAAQVLERRFADMVDIEFTVERGRLWLLQARRAKRSSLATFRAAVDMAEDPTFPLDRAGAVGRCSAFLTATPTIADAHDNAVDLVVAEGLAAAPGRAIGALCTDVDAAVTMRADGVDVVLVRPETSPADVHGLAAASGLVTTRGGLVSHAAIVARSWGLPAVVGADRLEIVADGVRGPGGHVAIGTVVTVDGDRGRLLLGAHPRTGTVPDAVVTIRRWAEASGAEGA